MPRTLTAIILSWLVAGASIAEAAGPEDSESFRKARQRMVEEQIEARGIRTPAVLEALNRIPRHFFVPPEQVSGAYADHPLPIGEGQTISQPYIVALMTDLLALKPTDRVLEVGTGSGYQAAVLSALAAEVATIEIKPRLHAAAAGLLARLGYANVACRGGDGYFGWEEKAPFDAVMITAAVDHIPPPLIKQLKDGGRMVLPLGSPFGYQNLVLVSKRGGDVTLRQVTGVLFVPLTGHALEKARP
jgi:protein-L-isoaspartate(D-aspartate) O-methyltransferase